MATRLRLPEGDRSPVAEFEKRLRARIVGQDRAIREICRALHQWYAGLKDPQHPIASLMFAGPTGVGKTETAKALADCFERRVVWRCPNYEQCGFEEETDGPEPYLYCPIHAAYEAQVPLVKLEIPKLLTIDCGEMGGSMNTPSSNC